MPNVYWMNRDTGELLTYDEMQKQFAEDYDGNDETNFISYHEYYKKVNRLEVCRFIAHA